MNGALRNDVDGDQSGPQKKAITDEIFKVAQTMSRLFVESSILAHYCIYGMLERNDLDEIRVLFGPNVTKPDFRPYFRMLTIPGSHDEKPIPPLPEAYTNHCATNMVLIDTTCMV